MLTIGSPQLQPQAIEHLCVTLNAADIFVDERCRQTAGHVKNLRILDIPAYDRHAAFPRGLEATRPVPDVAFYFHTSGTSAGLPKPIPQTHAAVSALPSFSDTPHAIATFTATPLYHGGIADCLRAWTSRAPIWFFPEGIVPITGKTLQKAIAFSRAQDATPVRYFSSVPYILQLLADDPAGLDLLRSMDLVGYGGAALAPSAGDRLVRSGVNLLSRFGSAECGFLLSSHRDYATDKAWDYLRAPADSTLLTFETHDHDQEKSLAELIVGPRWPLRAVTNRNDGSFATSDLFEPHAFIPNAWRLHSRADAQITLANGKKFDPAPLEAAVLAATPALRDVLIFGAGRDYPGALLFPADGFSDEQVLEGTWTSLCESNRDSSIHARVSRSMLVVVRPEGGMTLAKSSKGTILRRQAEEKYTKEIESAYYTGPGATEKPPETDEELTSRVAQCFSQVLGRTVDPGVDLYRQGVDSLSCIQIKRMIEGTCFPKSAASLPLNVIYDKGTVDAVARYICQLRDGSLEDGDGAAETQPQAMRKLADKYSDFQNVRWTMFGKQAEVIVLTGATGFLGAHVLHLLRGDMGIGKVICLLRAQTPSAARERVDEALRKRGMPGLEASDPSNPFSSKVVCIPADLSAPGLGLSEESRQWIVDKATIVIHSAWTVNFTLRLGSFEDQIAGTRNLIETAAQAGARFVFVSSTAAVISSPSHPIPEAISQDPNDASTLGYSQSKWVAEQVCAAANTHLRTQMPTLESHPPRITILRVGQLCGNRQGVWNMSEAYPLMLSTASMTGCLPDIPGVVLDWLPVELAAQAITDAARLPGPSRDDGAGSQGLPVFHILNPSRSPTWREMLTWFQEAGEGPRFEIVSPATWLEKLKAASGPQENHASQALLGLWQGMVVDGSESKGVKSSQSPVFSVTKACESLPEKWIVEPLHRERLLAIWTWVQSAGQES